jgi:hypothetical protein
VEEAGRGVGERPPHSDCHLQVCLPGRFGRQYLEGWLNTLRSISSPRRMAFSGWTSSRAQRPRRATWASRSPRTSPWALRLRGRLWLQGRNLLGSGGVGERPPHDDDRHRCVRPSVRLAVLGGMGHSFGPSTPRFGNAPGSAGHGWLLKPAGLTADRTRRTSVTIAPPISGGAVDEMLSKVNWNLMDKRIDTTILRR